MKLLTAAAYIAATLFTLSSATPIQGRAETTVSLDVEKCFDKYHDNKYWITWPGCGTACPTRPNWDDCKKLAEKVRVLISTGEVSNNKAVPVGDIDAKTSVGWGYGWGFGNCVATFHGTKNDPRPTHIQASMSRAIDWVEEKIQTESKHPVSEEDKNWSLKCNMDNSTSTGFALMHVSSWGRAIWNLNPR
ncbi:hypothetical protein P389DRAFT_196512 [Cystobasidium minutum MCA 4210]|uniref:uncharacterized protein n=1 Tax=Cystobasidium minutum MCA 4210 TaxID=1397322 RepID=UPI0034CEDD06|eukprot:jgi/Rhomi1/196512/gm1.4726_g